MDVINKLIKLVGLEYYMSIEQREEFFKSWSHTSILIKPDKENPKDKTALEAFDDDWNKIANVSKQDKHIVWMLLSNSEEKFVKAHVKKIDAEKNYLYISIDGVDLSNIETTFNTNKYEDLHISSPILAFPDIISCLHLSFLQAKEALANYHNCNSQNKHIIYKNLKFFIENYYNDISIDADIERQTLIKLMSAINDKDFDFFIEKMKYIGIHKGTIISNVHNLGDWMMKMEKSNMDKLIKMKFTSEYIEKVKMELSEFPNDLYDIYLQRPFDFLSNVYYCCLSRKTIAMLFSGIIFIDANENRNIDKHLNKASEKVKPEYISKEKIVIPNQIKDNNDKQSHGIINNEEVFIKCVNKSIVDKSQAIIWRVLYSILKTHNKFGYNGSLKDYYNDICVGKFNVKVTYNALSKTKGRYSFYKNDDLIESKVKNELPEIKRFYDCVDEYFKSKMNEYIN